MSACDTQNQTRTPQHTEEGCCAVEKSISEMCCPVDQSARMWTQAFFQAMKETQVDILKEKIRREWGTLMGKEADAIVTAMGVHWQSMLAQAKAQGDLRETIRRIFESAGKK